MCQRSRIFRRRREMVSKCGRWSVSLKVQGLAERTNIHLKIFAFNSGISTKKMYKRLLFRSLGPGYVLLVAVLAVRGYPIKPNLGQYYGSSVLRFKSLRILVGIFFVSSDFSLQRNHITAALRMI